MSDCLPMAPVIPEGISAAPKPWKPKIMKTTIQKRYGFRVHHSVSSKGFVANSHDRRFRIYSPPETPAKLVEGVDRVPEALSVLKFR